MDQEKRSILQLLSGSNATTIIDNNSNHNIRQQPQLGSPSITANTNNPNMIRPIINQPIRAPINMHNPHIGLPQSRPPSNLAQPPPPIIMKRRVPPQATQPHQQQSSAINNQNNNPNSVKPTKIKMMANSVQNQKKLENKKSEKNNQVYPGTVVTNKNYTFELFNTKKNDKDKKLDYTHIAKYAKPYGSIHKRLIAQIDHIQAYVLVGKNNVNFVRIRDKNEENKTDLIRQHQTTITDIQFITIHNILYLLSIDLNGKIVLTQPFCDKYYTFDLFDDESNDDLVPDHVKNC